MVRVHVVHFRNLITGRYACYQDECLIVLVDSFDLTPSQVKIMLEYEASHIFHQDEDHHEDFRTAFPYTKSEKYYTEELVSLLGDGCCVSDDEEYDRPDYADELIDTSYYLNFFHYRVAKDNCNENEREDGEFESCEDKIFHTCFLNRKSSWEEIPGFTSFRESPVAKAYIQGLKDQYRKDAEIIKEERDKYWNLYSQKNQ